jgi:SSS family solute:Na+ symporter
VQADERKLVLIGRITAGVAIMLAMATARPLLGNSEQAFQYIQEYTGFFTPGITVIFLLGLFWKRASEAGAIAGAVGSFVLSLALKYLTPDFPFMNRMLVVFVATLALAATVSLLRPGAATRNRTITADVDYSTSRGFSIAGVGVILILIALYATWW